ncbi:nicotinate-nucleotide adenylyltransferase [Burkholderiales bacterium]|nr:MAG: nicotinate-nucleotide adenylyltransferase [Burkholderiales bacterium]CAG0989015.1 nicotinate-nucleotide adenylyltransferase [Burkholderiales bacterium]
MNGPAGGLGVLGGTFDPVHLGHLQAALRAREALGLEEVRLIPAARPPHRARPRTADHHRLAMVQAAVADIEGLAADGRELSRPGPSYTFDTLRELRGESPSRPLFLILGADAFRGLASWHRWQELAELAHLAVVNRPGTDRDELPAALAAWVAKHQIRPARPGAPAGGLCFLDIQPLPISASDIRLRLSRGDSVADLLPPAVLAYIRSHHLYQRQADGSAET